MLEKRKKNGITEIWHILGYKYWLHCNQANPRSMGKSVTLEWPSGVRMAGKHRTYTPLSLLTNEIICCARLPRRSPASRIEPSLPAGSNIPSINPRSIYSFPLNLLFSLYSCEFFLDYSQINHVHPSFCLGKYFWYSSNENSVLKTKTSWIAIYKNIYFSFVCGSFSYFWIPSLPHCISALLLSVIFPR